MSPSLRGERAVENTPVSIFARLPMPPRWIVGALVLGCATASGACDRGRDGLAGAIDALVETAMEEGPISGVAVSVARGGRVIHSAGYGYADLENRLPVTPQTVFKVGSITKQFTAASILRLVGEGRLSLGDRLTQYLPEYPGYGSDVTVEQLLRHTSGVPNYTTMERWWETLAVEMPPRRLIGVFEREPFDFRPGARFSYSNSGYVLLGWIAEDVTGQPFGGILNERFFVPLDLESTSYCNDRALVPNRARGYRVQDGKFVHASHVSMSQAFAAGGVCSTAEDLIRWSRLLQDGRVVGRDGYRLMITPGTLSDRTAIEYGFGAALGYLEGRHRISHVGGMLGFTGQIAHYDEDDVTIVVLTNTEGAQAATLETDIARLILGLEARDVQDLLLAPEELQQYVGAYDISLTDVVVRREDGRLTVDISVPGIEGSHTLLYQGEDRFLAESDPSISLTFTMDGGSADGFVLLHKGITMRARRSDDPGQGR